MPTTRGSPGPVGGVGPRKTAQEGADGGGRLGRETEHAGGPAGAQHIGGYQRHQLVAGVGRSWGIAQVEVLLEKLGQAEVPGQGDRKCQPGIGYQAVVVEGDLGPGGVVPW